MGKGIPIEKRKLIHQKFKGRCAYCGCIVEYSKMHVDHIIPLYRKSSKWELERMGLEKGSGKLENLNPSCAPCNISKSTFTLENWRKEIKLKAGRVRKSTSNFRLLERFGIVKVRETEIVFYFEKK